MVRVLGHRQTKGAATDHPNLPSPRHISTLQIKVANVDDRFWPILLKNCSRLGQLGLTGSHKPSADQFAWL